jgi:predicted glycosyltransferase
MRRNLLIAETLVGALPDANILLLSGAHQLNLYRVPKGVDCVTLPAMKKSSKGTYDSRNLTLDALKLLLLRSAIIRTTLEAFETDVFIVDKLPRGLRNELEPGLRFLASTGRTRCVLGLRDILDAPETVSKEWSRARGEDAIREFYDSVWIYGDPNVYDQRTEYDFAPDVAAKVKYTGYLDSQSRLMDNRADEELDSLSLPPGRLVLCQMGGGQDGDRLANAFSQATLPLDTNAVILTGPFLPDGCRERLHAWSHREPRKRTIEFLSYPDRLLQRADVLITMGGYNSISEALCYGKPTLVVPRVKPRTEQLIRAHRFRELGMVDVLHPNETTPRALSQWMADNPVPPRGVRDRVDFKGLTRLPGLLSEVAGSAPRPGARSLQNAA